MTTGSGVLIPELIIKVKDCGQPTSIPDIWLAAKIQYETKKYNFKLVSGAYLRILPDDRFSDHFGGSCRLLDTGLL